MIYDAENRRMIMFGGEDSRLPWGDHYNDVWAVDVEPGNEGWRLLSPQGSPPSPRARLMAIYDSLAGRMVIFGGIRDFSVYFDDVSVVPEPATLALLGLGSLIALRRRKKL